VFDVTLEHFPFKILQGGGLTGVAVMIVKAGMAQFVMNSQWLEWSEKVSGHVVPAFNLIPTRSDRQLFFFFYFRHINI
jgi:hypothetical protein